MKMHGFRKYYLIIILICLTGLQSLPARGPLKETNVPVVPNQVIIKFKNHIDPVRLGKSALSTHINALVPDFEITEITPLVRPQTLAKKAQLHNTLQNIYTLKFRGNPSPEFVAEQLSKLETVAYAEPKYIHYISVIPDDSLYYRQNLIYNAVSAPQAWDWYKGETGEVIVAIVDGGTDIRHEDLQDNIWRNTGEIPDNNVDDDGNGYTDDVYGWNFANESGDPTGFDATPINQDHGTHTAGIVSAVSNNGKGVAGISWNTKIMGINVSTMNDDRSLIWGYDGIIYAAVNGADVINCSWGRPGNASRAEQEIIDYATALGTVVVAAAGNDNTSAPHFPSAYRNVISVAGTDAFDLKYGDSNYGMSVDLAAPAVNVYSLWHGDAYGYSTGTSMAAPMVSGAVGLVKTARPELNSLQAAELVRVTTDSLPAYGTNLGRGRLNLYRAVTENSPSVRIATVEFADENSNGIIERGEQVDLNLAMVNFLSPATNVIMTLSCPDPYITLQITQRTLPAINTMDTLQVDPFRFTVASNTPSAHTVTFKLTIETNEYEDYDYILANAVPAFGDLDINNLGVTITNIGRIGHPDPDQFDLGVGFTYMGGGDLLFEGALITGNAPTRLSNAARNDAEGYDKDFVVASGGDLKISTPGQLSDQESEGKFDDRNATNPLPVKITQATYAWADSANQDYFILLYTVVNTGSETLSDYYFGLFFDWDIDGNSYFTNKINYEPSRRLGIAYDSGGEGPETYTGVMALSGGEVSFRAINNDHTDPNNPSWGLYDGFSAAEKWEAISGGISYTNAGPADVSMVIASGPYAIPGNSFQRIAFAMVAANDSLSLLTSADSAKIMWERIIPTNLEDASLVAIPEKFSLSQNYPNPFNPQTTIEYSIPVSDYVTLTLYNVLGQEVVTLVDQKQAAGRYRVAWHATDFANGVYYYQLRTGSGFVQTRKLVLLK